MKRETLREFALLGARVKLKELERMREDIIAEFPEILGGSRHVQLVKENKGRGKVIYEAKQRKSRRRTKRSPELIAQLVDAIGGGMSYSKAAAKFKVPEGSIHGYMARSKGK